MRSVTVQAQCILENAQQPGMRKTGRTTLCLRYTVPCLICRIKQPLHDIDISEIHADRCQNRSGSEL